MIIDILIAVAVLLTTGVVAAIILALASHYFGVKTDEKVSRIREHLPGANCGACGYTGCDGYAEALASGEVKTTLCIPGGADVAAKISETLGVEAGDVNVPLAYVHCGGDNEATDSVAVFDGVDSCKAMCLVCGGPMACKYGCIGCGDCADVCPVDAICIRNGIAYVSPSKCIGCGLCVKTCPKHIISFIPRDAAVAVKCSSKDSGAATRKNCKDGCIGCKKCEKACPTEAIKVENNLASIDYEKCIKCGECAEVCPSKCIEKF